MAQEQGELATTRLREFMGRPAVKGFLWGLGTAAVVAVVWPRVRHRVRPLVVGALSQVVGLADEAVESATKIKEDFTDLMEEAKRKAREPEAAPSPGVEPGPDQVEIARLQESVARLQGQMAELAEMRQQVGEIRQLLRQAVGREGP
jgi:hypothetical protein